MIRKYKLETLEENLANIKQMEINFYSIISGFINRAFLNERLSKDFWYLNYAKTMGYVDYYWNYERGMAELAYSIYGFTNDVYHRIAYALDCINRKKLGRTIKNYEKDIRNLKFHEITNGEKEILINLKKERNYATHHGNIVFISYIFKFKDLIYNLLYYIDCMLSNSCINVEQFEYFMSCNYNFINELKINLECYKVNNSLYYC